MAIERGEVTTTPGVQRCLEEMLAAETREDWEDAEIVCSHGQCWLGSRRTSVATVNRMLRLCLVSAEGLGTEYERYTLNEDGRALAKDPRHEPQITRVLRNRHRRLVPVGGEG